MKAAVFALVLALAFAGPNFLPEAKNDGFNCDSSLNQYEVTSFTVTPYPIHLGQTSMTMTGTAHVSAAVKQMDIFVKYSGQNFYHEAIPETGNLEDGSPYTVNFSVNIPGIAPPGQYAVQVELTDSDGNHLNCWEVDFSLN